MKKITNFSLIVACFYTFTLSAQFTLPVRTMSVPYVSEPILIDGTANESSWSEAQELTVFYDEGWTDSLDLSGYFKITYDIEYLYFFADIKDDIDHSYGAGSTDPWMFDCIDIVIDLDTNNSSSYYDENTVELRLNRGEKGFTYFTGRADASDYEIMIVNKPDTGWISEVAIPWKAALPEGSSTEDIIYYISNYIGFDVVFNDSDGSDTAFGDRDAQMAWDLDGLTGEEYTMYMNTHVLGIITLESDELPEADAGPDQTVDENTLVNLDGTGSSDPGGSDITYTWTAPSPIELSDIHSPTPSFTAPDVVIDTSFQIYLVVRNDTMNSYPDPVIISVLRVNNKPVANAGSDTSVYKSDIIFFDGSFSYDSDEDLLSYIWRSADDIPFSDFTSVNPIAVAPSLPTKKHYSFSLTVSDGESYSEPDTIIVTIIDFTSIETPQNSPGEIISIYPNPASQYIHIESEALISEIEILDLSGKMLLNETLNFKDPILDLSGLSTGFYLVKLKTETGYFIKKIFLRE